MLSPHAALPAATLPAGRVTAAAVRHAPARTSPPPRPLPANPADRRSDRLGVAMLTFQAVALLTSMIPNTARFMAGWCGLALRRLRGPAPSDRFAAVVHEVMAKARPACCLENTVCRGGPSPAVPLAHQCRHQLGSAWPAAMLMCVQSLRQMRRSDCEPPRCTCRTPTSSPASTPTAGYSSEFDCIAAATAARGTGARTAAVAAAAVSCGAAMATGPDDVPARCRRVHRRGLNQRALHLREKGQRLLPFAIK